MNKDEAYWKIIALCNKGLIYKRVAVLLTGQSIHEIESDCLNAKADIKVLTKEDISDRLAQWKKTRSVTSKRKVLLIKKSKLQLVIDDIDNKLGELSG